MTPTSPPTSPAAWRRLFADAELQLIDDAGRWRQRDQAEVVAQTITTAVAHPVS